MRGKNMTMDPSPRERIRLENNLKRFAFKQNPMFRENIVQSMEVAQTYEFIDSVPEDCRLPGTLDRDQTKIVLGFAATRFFNEDGDGPIYGFSAWTYGSMLIHPRQLRLSNEAWHELSHTYIEEGTMSDEYDPSDILDGVEELDEVEVRDNIIDELTDSGVECELYQKTMYTYTTCEDSIESSYERAVSVGNAIHDEHSTHQSREDFGEWQQLETPEQTVWIAPRPMPLHRLDDLSPGEEVEAAGSFFSIVCSLGLDSEETACDLLPHEDKLREMMYIVECMRKRRIPRIA